MSNLINDMAEKAFSNPGYYRQQLLNAGLIEGDKASLSGKSFICVSLTRFCPVGCKFCFFKSGPVFKHPTREDLLAHEGMEKFINFANSVNLGYLLVSGGGEPMMERKSVLKIIEQTESERIVLVTSAHWAKTPESATRYLNEIVEALGRRQTTTSVTIRVSVDSEHSVSLGLEPVINLINLFSSKYKSFSQLDLHIHSLISDPIINEVINRLKDGYSIKRETINNSRISDGISIIKVVPKQEVISFDSLDIPVGYAKAFYSDLKVNLNNRDDIQKNIEVYQKDLFESEDGNSSIVTNKLGNPGLDFWVNYNGNVTTWGNQYLDNLFNIYVDSPGEVIKGSLRDPAALSFIEKGANYRDKVIAEANEIALLRSKAVNIRDYTGALMFDEARTRLYYTIRVLQDYIHEGRINTDKIMALPTELQTLLGLDKETLIASYNASQYTIVEQVIDKKYNKDQVLDILEWIKLGHYKISREKVNKLISFYNANVGSDEQINDISNIKHNLKMQVVRMTEHLTHIKSEALENLYVAA